MDRWCAISKLSIRKLFPTENGDNEYWQVLPRDICNEWSTVRNGDRRYPKEITKSETHYNRITHRSTIMLLLLEKITRLHQSSNVLHLIHVTGWGRVVSHRCLKEKPRCQFKTVRNQGFRSENKKFIRNLNLVICIKM